MANEAAMSEPVWQERFQIHTHEADMNGLARLDALFCCFQEAAGHHARDLGVGREIWRDKDAFGFCPGAG
jgi:hypothetical protein